MSKPACALAGTPAQREQVEAWARLPTAPQRVVLRSKIVLQAIAGVANQVIAATLGVTRPTVLLWRRRFTAGGPSALLRGLVGAPRAVAHPGLPRTRTWAINASGSSHDGFRAPR